MILWKVWSITAPLLSRPCGAFVPSYDAMHDWVKRNVCFSFVQEPVTISMWSPRHMNLDSSLVPYAACGWSSSLLLSAARMKDVFDIENCFLCNSTERKNVVLLIWRFWTPVKSQVLTSRRFLTNRVKWHFIVPLTHGPWFNLVKVWWRLCSVVFDNPEGPVAVCRQLILCLCRNPSFSRSSRSVAQRW